MGDFNPTQAQLELFRRNFNDEAFDSLKASVQNVIETSSGFDDLTHRLRAIRDVQCVELADSELENEDFVPNYENTDPENCDFLVLQCYAELDRSHMETESRYVEVCFIIVWNDVMGKGWIDAATLGTADNPEDFAERICFIDTNTHKPIVWCNNSDDAINDESSDDHQNQ